MLSKLEKIFHVYFLFIALKTSAYSVSEEYKEDRGINTWTPITDHVGMRDFNHEQIPEELGGRKENVNWKPSVDLTTGHIDTGKAIKIVDYLGYHKIDKVLSKATFDAQATSTISSILEYINKKVDSYNKSRSVIPAIKKDVNDSRSTRMLKIKPKLTHNEQDNLIDDGILKTEQNIRKQSEETINNSQFEEPNGNNNINKEDSQVISEYGKNNDETMTHNRIVLFPGRHIRHNNFTRTFLNILSRYNIKENDVLQNYALSRQQRIQSPRQGRYVSEPIVIRYPLRYNNLNHLPVDPLQAVYFTLYGCNISSTATMAAINLL